MRTYSAIYTRVSTEEQADGTSLPIQIHQAEQAAGEQKTPNCVFVDVASGAAENRPAFSALLAEISLKRIHTLTVYRLDRLARSGKAFAQIYLALRQSNCRLISSQEPMVDLTTSTGELLFWIFASVATYERNLTRDRTAAAIDQARKDGSADYSYTEISLGLQLLGQGYTFRFVRDRIQDLTGKAPGLATLKRWRDRWGNAKHIPA
jgi:DNA invertase Pin-like site-specific DNA recombinase